MVQKQIALQVVTQSSRRSEIVVSNALLILPQTQPTMLGLFNAGLGDPGPRAYKPFSCR